MKLRKSKVVFIFEKDIQIISIGIKFCVFIGQIDKLNTKMILITKFQVKYKDDICADVQNIIFVFNLKQNLKRFAPLQDNRYPESVRKLLS